MFTLKHFKIGDQVTLGSCECQICGKRVKIIADLLMEGVEKNLPYIEEHVSAGECCSGSYDKFPARIHWWQHNDGTYTVHHVHSRINSL